MTTNSVAPSLAEQIESMSYEQIVLLARLAEVDPEIKARFAVTTTVIDCFNCHDNRVANGRCFKCNVAR